MRLKALFFIKNMYSIFNYKLSTACTIVVDTENVHTEFTVLMNEGCSVFLLYLCNS